MYLDSIIPVMRHSSRDMVLLDDRILEVLADKDEFMTPSELADHDAILYSSQYVGDRCRKLDEKGLAKNVGNGVYMITEEGRGYLKEEYSVERGMWLNRDQASGEGRASEASTEGTNGT